jgi:hypothetical protein
VVWIEIDLLMLWFSCSIDCTYILYFRWTIPSFFFFYFFIHWTKGCKQSLPSIGRKSKEALFLKALKSFFSKFDWLNLYFPVTTIQTFLFFIFTFFSFFWRLIGRHQVGENNWWMKVTVFSFLLIDCNTNSN